MISRLLFFLNLQVGTRFLNLEITMAVTKLQYGMKM